MRELCKTEFYKFKRSKVFWGILLYMIIVPMLMPLVEESELNGKDTLILFTSMFSMLSFYATMIYSVTLTNEFSVGYIKDAVAFGYKRVHVLLSKFIFFAIGNVILGITPILCMLGVAIVQNGYGAKIGQAEFLYIVRGFLLEIILTIALCTVAFMLAFLLKRFYLMVSILLIVNMVNAFLVTSENTVIKKIYSYIIYSRATIPFQKTLEAKQVLQFMLVCFITILITGTCSVIAFKKMEIK